MQKSHSPRLVDRNLPFDQSRNVMAINIPQQHKYLKGLRLFDWFHVFLRFGTFTSFGLLIVGWTVMILVWAVIYQTLDNAYPNSCGLSGDSGSHFGVYFAFSLETCTTVGYGLPGSTNAFFENCPGIQVAIFFQMVWSMIYNAFLLAFFFARIAKSEDRAAQVIFSEKALIKKVHNENGSNDDKKGKWTFSFRVADVDAAFPVVEAHVRCYVKRGTELTPMRILYPNDDFGAQLLLSWPTVIEHEIDLHSPVYRTPKHCYQIPNNELPLRTADGVTGNRDEFQCPVCGETYGTMERLRKHVEYAQLVEIKDEYPVEGTHQTIKLEDLKLPDQPTTEQLKADFPDEIIVLVEGIDPLASGTFLALQSYTIDEICWSGNFVDCLSFGKSKTCLDLKRFHQIDSVAEEVKEN